jgi:hypothetical protein
MELSSNRTMRKFLNISKIIPDELLCGLKINLTIKANTLNNTQNYTILKNSDLITYIKYSNNTNTTSYMKNYNLSYPDQESLEILSIILPDLAQKDEICDICLNNEKQLRDVYNEIVNIKNEIKEFSTHTNSKQDVIAQFAEYINRVNVIKLYLYDLINVIELLKSARCKNYESNNSIYNSIMRKSNNLVEVIQNSIRKQSLNVNFIIIT